MSTATPGYPPGSDPSGQTPPPGAYPPPAYGQPAYGQPAWQPAGASGIPGVPALPPGVVLAPIGRRIGAYFLAGLLSIVTLGIGYIIWGLVVWGRGTSPALSVLKMRCIKVDTGQKATWGTMALRTIIGRIVDALFGIMYIVSFILFLTRGDRRSIHDLIGGTVVVYDPQGVMGK